MPAPGTLERDRWPRVAKLVREATRARDPRSVYRVREFMGSAAPYVDWCHRVRGIALSRELIFDPELIAAYADLPHGRLKSTTVGNHASRLQGITKVVNADSVQRRPSQRKPSDAQAPYTKFEVEDLWEWVDAHASAESRRELTILLAGGLGAGLTGREISDLRVGDITVNARGVMLRVGAPRERYVHVLPHLEHVFADAAGRAPAQAFVFLPHRRATAKNTASNFLTSNGRMPAPFSTQRARGTWITSLLTDGRDIRAVMQAMGVTDFSAIARYLKYVPALTPGEYRAQLRGEKDAA